MYTLPPLPYSYDALEPHIDARTMEIHHAKHHQAYIEKVIANLANIPEAKRAAVRNHGGGHANHSLFWQLMSADGGGGPEGNLLTAINTTFGSVATLKEEFGAAATNRF